ncbi:MAG: hypothetical protein ACTHQ3_08290 [Motilibacteraceae bacterium]
MQYAAHDEQTAERTGPALPRQREATGHLEHEQVEHEQVEHAVALCADEVAHAERLHGLVRRVLETGARTVRDPRALAVLVGVTDADRVYVASALAVH